MSNDTLRDGREPGFYIVDNELLDDYGPIIGVYGIAVYNALAYFANKNGGNIFPSYQTIADKLGMSRPKVISTIKKLVEVGLISKESRTKATGDQTSNEYTLVNLKGSKQHLPPSKPETLPSKRCLPPVVNEVNHRGKRGLPDQDPMNKTQLNKTKEQDDHLPGSFLRALAESSGFVYLDGNFNAVACKLEAEYSTDQLVRAMESAKEAHKKKIEKGERGITAPLAYIASILAVTKPALVAAKPQPQKVTIYNQYTGQHEERVIT